MAVSEDVTVKEARELLHVSTAKMAKLIKTGVLVTHPDLLDGRIKRVKLADVQRLLNDDKRRRHTDQELSPASA